MNLSDTPIIQFSPELDSLEEGYATSIHEIGGLAEPDDDFGEAFAQ